MKPIEQHNGTRENYHHDEKDLAKVVDLTLKLRILGYWEFRVHLGPCLPSGVHD